MKQFYDEDVPTLKKRNDVTLPDTRTAEEYSGGHADGFNPCHFEGGYRLYRVISNKKLAATECYPCGKNK